MGHSCVSSSVWHVVCVISVVCFVHVCACHEEDIGIQQYYSLLFPWGSESILENPRKEATVIEKVLDLRKECEAIENCCF